MKKLKRRIDFTWLVVTLALLWLFASVVRAQDIEITAQRPWMTERFERNVDEAALESQRNAVAGLKKLLKKYRGSGQESSLLERLADVEQQTAAIEFRVAHGISKKKTGSADLSIYEGLMKDSIATLKELIDKFPRTTDLAHAHSMLGRAYDETGERKLAQHEYHLLVGSFPNSSDASAAYMALADMASADNDNVQVLRYLSELEKRPEDPRHPFALYKMAWTYYNLKSIDKALRYLEKTAAYYESKAGKSSAAPDSSDQALRESALLDVPLFYLEGREQKNPQLTSEGAIRYFEGLDKGAVVGKMVARYAKLLRSHGLADDLMAFKTQVIRTRPDPQEVFDVLAITYEDQINHRRFAQLVSTSQEMSGYLLKNPSQKILVDRAEKLLLDTATVIQALIVKNKDSENVSQLNSTLAGVYAAFTQLVDEKDPRVAKVHYNLAESLFETRHFGEATDHYRWVVAHAQAGSKEQKDARQKAVASRYEELRARALIPKDMKAQPLGPAVVTGVTGLTPEVAEWVSWVMPESESFYFEATRCLYAAGNVRLAASRLREISSKKPDSAFAIPSASLLIDTYMASGDWAGVRDLVSQFSTVPAWKGSQFIARLHALDSEVGYKQLESSYSSKQYGSALTQAEEFLRQHPDSKYSSEALALAGNSALAVQDSRKALSYLSKVISATPETENGAQALLSRAKLKEDAFDFQAAAQDDLAWLDLRHDLTKAQEKQRAGMRTRALLLSWTSGNASILSKALHDPHVCSGDNEVLCERYAALSLFMGSNRGKEITKHAFANSHKGADENKSLWAALSLEGVEHLAFRDRNICLQQLVSHWGELDPLIQVYLLPSISHSVPEAFRVNRQGIQEVAPLVTNEHYLTYRVDIIREFETIAVKTSKLPGAKIQSVALNEVASAYLDFARGLRTIAQKKEGSVTAELDHFLLPFEEKGQQLRMEAFKIAANSAIEDEDLEGIAQPFIQDNPSQAKLLVRDRVAKPRSLDLFALDVFDPEGQWQEKNGDRPYQERFVQAIRQKQWAQIAVLLHEGRERKLVPASRLGLMRAVALTSMGAQAEGLQEFADVASTMSAPAKKKMLWILLAHYFRSNSRSKTGEILKLLAAAGAPTGGEEDSVSLANAAAKWIGG